MQKIAAALVKAQKAFGPALKNSVNPHLRAKYAALDACIEAVIDGLNDNGIMLMQQTHLCDDGVIVETTFIHESGEMLSAGKLHVPATKKDAQGYGSALTYAKRYSLQSACGIASADDDGQAASKPKTTPTTQSNAEYSAYEAKHLNELQAAAMNGSTSLAEAFGALPKSDLKAALWKTHGASLKDAGVKADKVQA